MSFSWFEVISCRQTRLLGSIYHRNAVVIRLGLHWAAYITPQTTCLDSGATFHWGGEGKRQMEEGTEMESQKRVRSKSKKLSYRRDSA